MLASAEMVNSVKVYLIIKILNSAVSRLPAEHQKCKLVEYFVFIHASVQFYELCIGLAGCGVRDYLERIKQLTQFFGQIDEMLNKEPVRSLKPRISVEVCSVCEAVDVIYVQNLYQ